MKQLRIQQKARRVLLISMAAILLGWAPSSAASAENDALASVFGKERPANGDVIYFDDNHELHGRVENTDISIYTVYGLVRVPREKIAGVSFIHSKSESDLIITTNFNRVSGIIVDPVIQFKTGKTSPITGIRKEKIKTLLMKINPPDQTRASPSFKTDLFLMSNSDLLTGVPADPDIVIHTDYANVPVNFADIQTVTITSNGNITAEIEKKNSDTIKGGLITEELTLNLDIGTRVEGVYIGRIARIFVDDGRQRAGAYFGVIQPAQAPSPAPAAEDKVILNSIGMEFRLILPGTFTMGSNSGEDNERPAHQVTIAHPFYLGTHEVTQAQWNVLMNKNPSKFKSDSQPVENVSFNDVMAYIKKLSEKENANYRLPAEEEWEYACRAGSNTAFYWGNDFNVDYAWCDSNSGGQAQPVGLKKPNAWGLYDMSGNVWEWCGNLFSEYPGNLVLGKENFQAERAVRGGSWDYFCKKCTSSVRNHNDPNFHYNDLGFRLVLEKKSQ